MGRVACRPELTAVHCMDCALRLVVVALLVVGLELALAAAQTVQTPVAIQPAPLIPTQPPSTDQFSGDEIVDAGQHFFSSISRGLASVIEKAVSRWGLPNGYILGEEAGGAFIGGLRYGGGKLYTKNAGDMRVYWQGPTLGFDAGADGARTMMLVYNLPRTEAIFERFGGLDGSAYLVGGFGMTALTTNDIVVVPIRSGVGFRLGANLGYLKFTPTPTWNPFDPNVS